MRIGYARVSTLDQHLELQLDALEKAHCDKVFTDKVSSTKAERPGLREALEYLRSGDTLVVWKLDRLGRSLRNLIDTITSLDDRGIGFNSLQENLDTTTSGGRLVFHIFGALAEFDANSSGKEPMLASPQPEPEEDWEEGPRRSTRGRSPSPRACSKTLR